MPQLPRQCDKCGRLEVDVDPDGNLTCFHCGAVLDESQNYRNEVELSTTGGKTRACGSTVTYTSNGITASTSVPRNGSVHRRTEINPVIKQLDIIGNKLNVGETLITAMHIKYMDITAPNEDTGEIPEKYTRSPDLLAAAVAYIVLRQNNKPFTLLDISQAIQKNMFKVGRVYDLVLRRNGDELRNSLREGVHPSIFIDKVCAEIKHVDPKMMATIKAYANQIIDIIRPHWTHDGKRLDAICAATIYIAAEGAGSFSSLKDLCNAIKAGEGTAKNRIRDVKQELLQIVGKEVPWLRDIGVKDMHKYLGKMLSQYETLVRLNKVKLPKKSPLEEACLAKKADASSPSSPSSPASPCSPAGPPRVVSASTTTSDSEPGTPPPSSPLPASQSPPTTPHNSTTSSTILNVNITTDNSTYEDKEDVKVCSGPLPNSYVISMATRSRRQVKLDSAKRRLRDTLESNPALAEVYSPALIASLMNLPPPPPLLLPPAPPSPTQDNKAYPIAPTYKKRSPPSTPRTPPMSSSPPSPPGKTFAELANAPAAQRCTKSSARTSALSLRRKVKQEQDREKEREKKVPLIETPLNDPEDALIEKLLMNGVSEDQILDGYYFSEQLSTEIKEHPDIHSETLGEHDIPEEEMCNFIRTAAEVKVFSQFDENENEPEEESKKEQKKRKTPKTKKAGAKRSRVSKQKRQEVEDKHSGGEEGEAVVIDSETETGEEVLQFSRKKSRASTV